MKKIFYLLLATVTVSTISCKKFLKEEPQSFISEENYYKTQNDAIYGVNAVYFMLNSGGTSYQTPYNILFSTGMDMASDDVDPGPGATNPDVRSLSVLGHSSANLRVYEIWQQHYAAIRKANVALAKIPGIDFDGILKSRLLGEAKFLRALYYFNLVRLYGDVPLVTEYDPNAVTADDYAVAKSPSIDVYAQIEKDLNEAATVLPNSYGSPDVGRATKGAALALLSKVYLTKASFPLRITSAYQDAVNTALQAITPSDVPGASGVYGYALQANYNNVFLPAQKNNSEHIFSAQFKSNSQAQGNNQNPRSIYTLPAAAGITGSYAEMVRFYKNGADNYFSIYKMYQPADKRKKNGTFVTKYLGKNGVTYSLKIVNPAFPNDSTPFFNKWWDPTASVTSESAANVSIIRYADLLLIHAEAANEVGDLTAYDSYNKVRARAGLPIFASGSLTQAQFRDSVYKDRRLELVFEYSRWFDLIRQRDASGNSSFTANLHLVGKTNAQDYHRLYPIPLSELAVNPKITQNPGW